MKKRNIFWAMGGLVVAGLSLLGYCQPEYVAKQVKAIREKLTQPRLMADDE